MKRALLRLLNAVRRGRAESDLEREVAEHLALIEEANLRRGMTPQDARRAARLALGGVEQTKELHRDARSFVWLDDMRRDISYAARLLRRNPVFALTAALSLAIGIGATTTIFTAANGLLLRTAPGVADPDRLVDISLVNGKFGVNLISYPNYIDIRDRATTLESVFGYRLTVAPLVLEDGIRHGGAEPVFYTVVTTNYFTALGVSPQVGRLFGVEDVEQPGTNPVVVLSHSFWMRRFDGDPGVVGRTVRLNGHPFTVIGVGSPEFRGTVVVAPDIWLPVGAAPFSDASMKARFAGTAMVGGRLKPGVSIGQAAAELDAVGRALEREYPAENQGTSLSVSRSSPIPAGLRMVATGFLALLMGIVSLVLAIACTNVAGVLLARAAARRREVAVRLAMGVGRARLVRQLLTETLLLFLLGGFLGLLLARWMTTLLFLLLPTFSVPVQVSLPLDARVVLFTGCVSLIAAILSGLAPALQASRVDVVAAMKNEAQGLSDRMVLRHGFVVAQVAFSVLLVVVSGLMIRALNSIDRGYDAAGVEITALDLTLGGYTRSAGEVFLTEVVDRVRRLPGVKSASMAFSAPSHGGGMGLSVTVPGLTPPNGEPFFRASGNIIGPAYLATMEIPLLAGREFTDEDRDGGEPVAVVSASAAHRYFPDTPIPEVIGKSIVSSRGVEVAATSRQAGVPKPPIPQFTSRRIVGVARDVTSGGPTEAMRPFVYLPLQQVYVPQVVIVARSTRGQRLSSEVRELLSSMNPRLPVLSSQTLAEQSAPVVTQLRVAAPVSGTVGMVGLLLAAMGIYGVTAFTVACRTREIGIRMALGAERADVIRMILRQGMSLVALGGGIGLAAAAAVGRLLSNMLFGVAPFDAVLFAGSVVLFGAIGLIACFVPARRAIRINPTEALRYE